MNESEAMKGQEIGMDVRRETLSLLQKKGPKLDKVLLRLRQSLNAKETKIVKIKGAINEDELPKGFNLIGHSGLLTNTKDGDIFGTGESLVACDLIAHGHRLRAVELALQLHDAMPSQKHEHLHEVKPLIVFDEDEQ